MNNVTVSAIVPCHNGSQFITRALDSIASQTHPVKEIIFVDDGSTDDSAEIANNWKHSNANIPIIIVKQANLGVSAARNQGIRLATSEWFALLDIDDFWHPEHNHLLCSLIPKDGNCSAIFCDARRIRQTSNGLDILPTAFDSASIMDMFQSENFHPQHTPSSPLYTKLLSGSFLPTCSSLIKLQAFNQTRGYELGRAYGEDRKLWLELFHVAPILLSNRIASDIYLHDHNATHSNNAINITRSHIDLALSILENPLFYQINKERMLLMNCYIQKLMDELRYQASISGVLFMIKAQYSIHRKYGLIFHRRDWIRGLAHSLQLIHVLPQHDQS